MNGAAAAPNQSQGFWRRLRKTPLRDALRFRVTGRLDVAARLAESGLADEPAALIRRVVKRTRLWRMEKVGVADELIAHFLDARAAGVADAQAVADFGDPVAAARLIRRAKKRNRPAAWKVVAWVGRGLAVFAVLYVLAGVWLLLGSPSIDTDYLAKLNARAAAVPADEAAWPGYRAALLELDLYTKHEWTTPNPQEVADWQRQQELYGPGGDYEGYAELGWDDPSRPPHRETTWSRLASATLPGTAGWDEMTAFLEEHADTLARVREAAAKPGLGFEVGFAYDETYRPIFDDSYITDRPEEFDGPHPPMISVLLLHLSPIRHLATLLTADAHRAAEAGDGQRATENLIAAFRMAPHADETPLLICGMVRLSITELALDGLQRIFTQQPDLFDDLQLRRLVHVIAVDQPDVAVWINAEQWWFYDMLQRVYTDDGRGNGKLTRAGMLELESVGAMQIGGSDGPVKSTALSISLPAVSVVLADREDMRAKYDRLMSVAATDARRPLHERVEEGALFSEQHVSDMRRDPVLVLRYYPIWVFMPSFDNVIRKAKAAEAHRDAALCAIALEIYRRDHGGWPESLDELSPRYLPAVPIDPFDGRPMRYRLVDGMPLLYSVGQDGDDDGGRLQDSYRPLRDDAERNADAGPCRISKTPMDGDWVLWPRPLGDH